jgi:predicted O-methyltransferase YrrM
MSILQIGVGTGYESLWLALGPLEIEILAIDEDLQALERVGELLGESGVAGTLKPLHGEAKELIPTLEGSFDLVLLKSGAAQYRRCLDLVLPKLRVGGLVVVDDLLPEQDASSNLDDPVEEGRLRATRAFNGYFMVHPQLTSVILPVARGVGIATKLKPLMTEVGGPF